jgi:uncharacterized peroxidase-related enzyme
MAWIETVDEDDATGNLRTQYDLATKRAGRVFNILKLSSLNPELNRVFMEFYVRLMRGRSELSRREREMIATSVSRANHCHY